MKRIKGGNKVIRGKIATGTYNGIENRIQLFDGKFNTGYKVVKFQISPTNPASSKEITSRLSTEPKGTIYEWNWADIQQVAWCGWNIPLDSRFGTFTEVDPDNMIIQDLWISSYTSGEATNMNYIIELEKYEMTSWDGAASMVRNNAQAGP